MGWTDERTELMQKLWQDGLSASQVARQLGGVSRNAVIGKVFRMGLQRGAPSRPTRAVKVRPERPARPLRNPQPRPPRVSPPMVARYVDETPGIATPSTIGAHMCRWPIGDPTHDHFTFCGRGSDVGPYCVEHAGVAYQPRTQKTSAANLARSLRRYL
ncbi:MAG: GcrA cell cycle regulator [Salinibacterium sp.]|nr:MAG: GcrA cell cycle regulator [Salinibacterium sp.]